MSFTRPLTTTGNITTNSAGPGNTVALAGAHAYAVTGIQVTGTWTGTLTVEGTVDGTNFATLAATPAAGGAAVTTTTANGLWRCNIAGMQSVRLRGSAAMTGSAVVTIIAAPFGSGGV